jgi:hypothetical protein
MSIKEYGPGEHPSGFIGIRLSVTIAGESNQRYFTFKDKASPSGIISDAEQEALRLEANSAHDDLIEKRNAYQASARISSGFASKPFKKMEGPAGISFTFSRQVQEIADGNEVERHYPCIDISLSKVGGTSRRVFITKNRTLDEAWLEVADLYAEIHELSDEQRIELEIHKPSAETFMSVYRDLTRKGADISEAIMRERGLWRENEPESPSLAP